MITGPIMALLRGVPLLAWALAAALAWGGWQRHLVGAMASDLASQQATAAALREASLEAALSETSRRMLAQREIVDDARKMATQARADADAAGAVAGRLRARLAAVAAACRATDPAASSGGQGASDAAGVLADLLVQADTRAGILAEAADRSHAAAVTCERAYDALITGPESGQALPAPTSRP